MGTDINTVWIDLDNSPHVPIFRPIIDELSKNNIKTIITTRDYAQTVKLIEFYNLPHKVIGKHGGKNKIKKILNLFSRAISLRKFITDYKIDLAVSHGSRTQLLAAKFLGIKSLLMMDYEYTESIIFNLLASRILVPDIIPDERLKNAGINLKKIHRYEGFKEELYLKNFKPDPSLRSTLNISSDKILVTIRPPAMLGNYHNSLSETILLEILNNIVTDDGIYPLIISRTEEDRKLISDKYGNKIHFLEFPVDGLQLIWNSDLLISGGGTMNREATLLGVPVYSIFTGKKPYIDEHFEKKRCLSFIDSLDKINNIIFKKREILNDYTPSSKNLSKEIVDFIKNYKLK